MVPLPRILPENFVKIEENITEIATSSTEHCKETNEAAMLAMEMPSTVTKKKSSKKVLVSVNNFL